MSAQKNCPKFWINLESNTVSNHFSVADTHHASSSFDELGPAIDAVKNQGWIAQLINSKDNASSLDKSWKKLDRIISDAGASSLVFPYFFGTVLMDFVS